MEKYLVKIEFRYLDSPKYEHEVSHVSKTVTIGVYDDFDEACRHGNSLLEELESRFPLHVFPDGSEAKRDRFGKRVSILGTRNKLVSDNAYLKTPFGFYASIVTLKYEAIDDVINDVLAARKRYKKYKNNS